MFIGNFSKSMHFSEGSYEKIAEQFFKTLNYDTFYLEYDNLRSGGFEPLRFLPVHKNVVLGVVTTKVHLSPLPRSAIPSPLTVLAP